MDAPDHVMSRFRRMLDLEQGERDPAAPLPEVVGHYRILRVLGTGASAVVCEAEDLSLRRRVALKVLRSADLETKDPKFLARFHREASLIASLRHPNIVTIHEVSMFRQPDGSAVHYIVMDCVPGTLLQSAATRKPTPEEATRLILTIARAIHHAHQKGIVHRDLKPANILIDDEGRPVVTDFGLAKEVTDSARLTQHGAAVGTPLYMSPEQVGGRPGSVGPATDVYALGVMLFELLTGTAPFHAESLGLLYARILTAATPEARSINRAIPADLSAICRKAMEKDARDRYPSALALAEDLERHLAGDTVVALRTNAISQIGRVVRRYPGRIAAGLLAIAAAIVVPLAVQHARQEGGRAGEEKNRRIAQARESLSRLLSVSSRNPDYARFQEEAEALIGSCCTSYPDDPDSLLLNVEYLVAKDRYDDADRALGQARRIAPRDSRTLLFEARLRAFELLEAVTDQTIVTLGHDESAARPDQDPELASKWRVATAALAAARTLTDIPSYQKEFVEGLLAHSESRWADGVRHFTAYLDVVPADTRALLLRCWAQLSLSNLDAALADVTTAINMSPSSRLYRSRAVIQFRRADYAAALGDLKRAHQAQDPTYHLFVGEVMFHLNDVAGAIDELGQAIALAPQNGLAYVERADVFEVRGQPGDAERAVADCNRALELGIATPHVYELRSTAYARLGKYDDEAADLEHLIGMVGGEKESDLCARLGLAYYEAWARTPSPDDRLQEIRLDKALKNSDLALKGKPSFPYPYLIRAEAAFYRAAKSGRTAGQLESILGDIDAYLEIAPEIAPYRPGGLKLREKVASELEKARKKGE